MMKTKKAIKEYNEKHFNDLFNRYKRFLFCSFPILPNNKSDITPKVSWIHILQRRNRKGIALFFKMVTFRKNIIIHLSKNLLVVLILIFKTYLLWMDLTMMTFTFKLGTNGSWNTIFICLLYFAHPCSWKITWPSVGFSSR